MINCLSDISLLHNTLWKSHQFNMKDIQSLSWSGLRGWVCGQQQSNWITCVALSPTPCKGEKIFWSLLLAFSNTVRQWEKLPTGKAWACHLLLLFLGSPWFCSIVSDWLHIHPPNILIIFVNTFLKSQTWRKKERKNEWPPHTLSCP